MECNSNFNLGLNSCDALRPIGKIVRIAKFNEIMSAKVRQRLVILATAEINGWPIETSKHLCDQLPHETKNYWNKDK